MVTGKADEWTDDNDGALHPLPAAEQYARLFITPQGLEQQNEFLCNSANRTKVSNVVHESVTLTITSCNLLLLLYNGGANASGVR